MSVSSVLRTLAQPADADEVEVLALEVGMVIALPCREQWLPWEVVEAASPVGELPLVRFLLRRTGHPWSSMQRLFSARESVLVVPRHHGVCARCGGLAPCADELVERELRARADHDDDRAGRPGLTPGADS